ncbi:integral membrane protein [Colletotrichum falcatum]|nr:integral membrane protein [Colletotrichum falcatum]
MSTLASADRDAENKGPTALGIVISMSVLSTLFTAGRLYVRGKIMGRIHLDDYLIIAAVICGWANVGTATAAVNYGNGRHFDTLDLEQKSGAILWTIAGFPFGVMSFGLPKLAVVSLLTKLMNPSRRHTIFLWFMSLFCLANLIGCIIILFAQCQPTHSQWDFTVKNRTCWSPYILVYYAIFAGAVCGIVDLYLAVYPAVVLAGLQMNIKKKVALSIALGIGSVSSVVAIYKCTRLPSLASQDFSYDTADLVIWTIRANPCSNHSVEGSTMIIASCIPVLKPLAELIFGKHLLSSASNRYNYENYGSGPSGQARSDIEMSGSRKAKFNMKRGKLETDVSSLGEATVTATQANGSQETILNRSNTVGKIYRTDAYSVVSEPEKSAPVGQRGKRGM